MCRLVEFRGARCYGAFILIFEMKIHHQGILPELPCDHDLHPVSTLFSVMEGSDQAV